MWIKHTVEVLGMNKDMNNTIHKDKNEPSCRTMNNPICNAWDQSNHTQVLHSSVVPAEVVEKYMLSAGLHYNGIGILTQLLQAREQSIVEVSMPHIW